MDVGVTRSFRDRHRHRTSFHARAKMEQRLLLGLLAATAACAGAHGTAPRARAAANRPRPVPWPRQLRLAFADESTMAVGWLTDGPLSDPLPAGSRPLVRYAPERGAWQVTAGETAHDGDASAPFLHYYHDVLLTELHPGTRYTYTAGAGTLEGAQMWSEERSFTTLAEPSADGAFKCSIFGDMGVTSSAPTIARLAEHTEHAFIIHVGDISYADDLSDGKLYDGGRGYEAVYDTFGEMVEPLTSTKAYFVAPGNHDVACHILSDRDCIAVRTQATSHDFRFQDIVERLLVASGPPELLRVQPPLEDAERSFQRRAEHVVLVPGAADAFCGHRYGDGLQRRADDAEDTGAWRARRWVWRSDGLARTRSRAGAG